MEAVEMKFVYVVLRCHPFMGGFMMWTAFLSEEAAKAEAARLTAELTGDDKPEYDDWGLVSGIEFTVSQVELL
jgi:hypothetical protein